MVIDSKPQDMKNIHCVNLNNHPILYATKYKYRGHIISNSLTGVDDFARPKRCFYAQANVLAGIFCLLSAVLPPKYFI